MKKGRQSVDARRAKVLSMIRGRQKVKVQAGKAFMGCTGISPDGEILCGIPTELGINETMISHAREYYILADHTKIGKTGTYASCSLEKTGTIITDELASAHIVERLRTIGMTVIQVGTADFPEPPAAVSYDGPGRL